MTVATNLSCFFGSRLVALLLVACVPAEAFSPSANAVDLVTMKEISPSANAVDLVTMKEIVSVTVHDPKSVDPPFASGVSGMLPKGGELYTTFRIYGEKLGESTVFDEDHKALVSLPLEAAEEGKVLECEIKKRLLPFLPDKIKERLLPFLPDKTLFTAKLNLIDAKEGYEYVSGTLCGPEGNDVGTRIELKAEVFVSEWNRANMGEPSPNPDTDNGDFYFQVLEVFVKLLNKNNQDLAGTEILEKPQSHADKNLTTEKSLDGLLEYPIDDEFLQKSWKDIIKGEGGKIVLRLLNNFWSKRDTTTPVSYRLSAINDVRMSLGAGVKSPYEDRWVRPLSDDSMERVFFSSLGMELVQKDPESGGYVADLTCLGPLNYKTGFENVGCKVYFDANATLTKITNYKDDAVFRPGGKSWEWAKLKARTNIFITASLKHLMEYHFIWGSAPGQALRMFLPPTHPIRMSFSVHFCRTHYTCSLAKPLLLDEFGVLGRALPFAYKGGYKKHLCSILNDFKFQTYPDQLESQGVKDCSFHVGATDGIAMHTVMMNYASEMFDEVYLTEERFLQDESMRDLYKFLREKIRGLPEEYSMANVKMMWGEILFRVTGAHNSIGNVAAYALSPFMLNLRMLVKDNGIVRSSKESDTTVAAITYNSIPDVLPRLSQDWSHVLKDPESPAYKNLNSALEKLGDEIEERNAAGKDRRFINRDFHPDDCAISIFG